MTIRGKEIEIGPSFVNLFVSANVRAGVAIAFFMAYLATALVL